MSTYEQSVSEGNNYLKHPKYIELAQIMFETAIKESDNPTDQAKAYQLLSIARRLDGQFDAADTAMAKAYQLARGDQVLIARLDRDSVFSLIDQTVMTGNDEFLVEAFRLSKKSMDVLDQADEMTEYGASTGAFARCYIVKYDRLGTGYHLSQARRHFASADDILRRSGNRQYELNNLMWAMLVENIDGRLALVLRVLRLINRTGDHRRYKQLLSIVVGGRRAAFAALRRRVR